MHLRGNRCRQASPLQAAPAAVAQSGAALQSSARRATAARVSTVHTHRHTQYQWTGDPCTIHVRLGLFADLLSAADSPDQGNMHALTSIVEGISAAGGPMAFPVDISK